MNRKVVRGTGFGMVSEDVLNGFHKALIEGSTKEPFPIELWDVTYKIQVFIEGAYGIGLNPLSHLRHIFDCFNWEFCKPISEHPIAIERWRKETIARADFFWFAQGPEKTASRLEYVIARRTRIDEPPMRVFATCSLDCLLEDYNDKDGVLDLFKAGARDEPGEDWVMPTEDN